jgi:cellulose synthase/poly-beta-1,6-N-acetylglucosamine synthase-like glycosyltransferase
METAGTVMLPTAAGGARFWWLFSLVLTLLLAVAAAAFLLPQPWSWLVGITYVIYESWLTGRLFASSRRAVLTATPSAQQGELPALAVLIAARNERSGMPATLAELARQVRPGDEVLVVDDGSTDDTLAWLQQAYALVWQDDLAHSPNHPWLRVQRQVNRGKARSLNTALTLTTAPVVMTIDADTLPDAGALDAVRRSFSDPAVEVACGVLRPLCQHGWSTWFFAIFQRLEYRRSYLWRMGWMRDRTLVLVSGAFAVFRRPLLEEVGGFDPLSKAEDYELLFRLHAAAAKRGQVLGAVVISDARAITDAPGTVRQFLRQRTRWFAGFIETMVRHRGMVGNPACGRLGTYHLLVKTVDLLLPLYGLLAVILLAVYLIAGGEIHAWILILLLGKLAYDLALHLWSMVLHRRWQGDGGITVGTLIATLLEPIAFQPLRQLGAACGWIAYLRRRIDWAPQRPTGKT